MFLIERAMIRKTRHSLSSLDDDVPSGQLQSRQPWLTGRVPNGYWDTRANRVQYLNWLAERCGFLQPGDWYAVRKSHFRTHFGGGLLRNQYGSSIWRAMNDFLPEHDWKPWLFGATPDGFW